MGGTPAPLRREVTGANGSPLLHTGGEAATRSLRTVPLQHEPTDWPIRWPVHRRTPSPVSAGDAADSDTEKDDGWLSTASYFRHQLRSRSPTRLQRPRSRSRSRTHPHVSSQLPVAPVRVHTFRHIPLHSSPAAASAPLPAPHPTGAFPEARMGMGSGASGLVPAAGFEGEEDVAAELTYESYAQRICDRSATSVAASIHALSAPTPDPLAAQPSQAISSASASSPGDTSHRSGANSISR